MVTTVVPNRRAAERAYQYTKAAIISGEIRGGELLSEGEVAEVLELSRSPVRAAFLLLASEGLLRLHPKRGSSIVPVTPDEVRDVLAARCLVEPWAAAAAAQLSPAARQALVVQLARCVERGHQADDNNSVRHFDVADCDFHTAIVVAAGNALLSQFHHAVQDRRLRILNLWSPRRPDYRTVILTEHERLLTAIAAGDEQQTVVAIHTHLGQISAPPPRDVPLPGDVPAPHDALPPDEPTRCRSWSLTAP